MLEVIYNDCYSMLTILNNLNNECFNVVDDEFNVYETLPYNPFEPTKDDLLYLFQKSLSNYYDLENKEEHIIAKAYRQNMYDKSLRAYKQWLNEHKEMWGGEDE